MYIAYSFQFASIKGHCCFFWQTRITTMSCTRLLALCQSFLKIKCAHYWSSHVQMCLSHSWYYIHASKSNNFLRSHPRTAGSLVGFAMVSSQPKREIIYKTPLWKNPSVHEPVWGRHRHGPDNNLAAYQITLVPGNLLQATVIAMGIPSPALPFDWIQKLGPQLS